MDVVVEQKVIFGFSKPFWVVWAIELWERFGYYGVQSILALYFVGNLGYSESKSFYVFGSFAAFSYGFIWVGGWIGDKYLGAKRTMVLGAVINMLSYASLAIANHNSIFYSLAGVVVGNALFKANPSSLISKLYEKGDSSLDSAMTLYYMAINIGSMLSISLTPIISQKYGSSVAFFICSIGLFIGLANYFIYSRVLDGITTSAGLRKLCFKRYGLTILGGILAIIVIAQLLDHTKICDWVVYIVVTAAFIYYLKLTFSLQGVERTRMLVSFVLILQGVLFFVLYNQIPTSLTFFSLHNVNNHFLGMTIPAAEYQVLNPIAIVVMSPILALIYNTYQATHVTKFCIGMSLAALAFLVLGMTQYVNHNGLVSPYWLVISYFLQSTGELLISGLGLAMVAELCPRHMSGFVMGVWWLTSMLAGPIGAWVGSLTTHAALLGHMSMVASLHIYSAVFEKIGLFTALCSLLMWLMRPFLNKVIEL